MVVAVDLGEGDFPEAALTDDLFTGLDQVRRAPALRAYLDNSPELAGGSKNRLSLTNIDADWFLEEEVHRIPSRQSQAARANDRAWRRGLRRDLAL
jgi:hypothetical protein